MFPNWFKGRLLRIYPSIISIAILSCLFFGNNENIVDIILAKKYWFVSCIFIHYAVLFFIGSYAKGKTLLFTIPVLIAALLIFVQLDNTVSIWHGHYLGRYVLSFNATLLGAYMGENHNKIKYNPKIDWLGLLLSYACFRFSGLFYKMGYVSFDLLRVIPLYLFVYFLYKVCKSRIAQTIYDNKYAHFIIMTIGSLCLEIYIVQKYVLFDSFNHLFPLNLFIVFSIILVSAYITRIFGQFILQVFQKEPFQFKQIFKL